MERLSWLNVVVSTDGAVVLRCATCGASQAIGVSSVHQEGREFSFALQRVFDAGVAFASEHRGCARRAVA